MAASVQSETPGLFDRFAGWVAERVAKASFFIFAVLMVIVWIPTLFFLEINTSQLIINTATTIGTWMLVSLLQNTTTRADTALQAKANAIAEGLADLSDALGHDLGSERLHAHARDLRAAVGLEERVHS